MNNNVSIEDITRALLELSKVLPVKEEENDDGGVSAFLVQSKLQ